MQNLLSIRELAERLGLCRRTVARLVDGGKLPRPIRVGGSLRWRPEAIETWLSEQTR